MGEPPWTSPLLEEATAYYEALLRPVFSGRRFLHAGGVATSLAEQARLIAALGAERPFLVADDVGTGTLPTEEEAEWVTLGIGGDDIVDQMRRAARALRDLPADVCARIDAWDPDGNARWLCRIMLEEIPEIAGRRKYGLREPPWTALEDKVTVDALWDDIGIRRAPSRIVAPELSALRAAAEALDRGMGTVWAADSREGMNGGAIGLRWVRPLQDGAEAAAHFAARCDRVRVMPFLEGIPASIHGIVFPGDVAVFRPVEMVVLRPDAGDGFLYAGCSTWFDPRQEDRDAMHGVARRVGTSLRERMGFRGPFTVDGVVTEEGFRPTELNPRFGGGLSTLARGLGTLPLMPLCWAVTEGEDLPWRPELLERSVVEASDAVRGGGGWSVFNSPRTETEAMRLVMEGDEIRLAGEGEDGHASLRIGPGTTGGFVRIDFHAGAREPGPPAAPDVARIFRWTDEHLGTGFGPLTAAVNLRP